MALHPASWHALATGELGPLMISSMRGARSSSDSLAGGRATAEVCLSAIAGGLQVYGTEAPGVEGAKTLGIPPDLATRLRVGCSFCLGSPEGAAVSPSDPPHSFERHSEKA